MAAALPPEVLAVAAAKPLYDHDGPVAVAVGWSLFTVSTILLAARFYVTFGMRRPGGWPLIWLCVTYVSRTLFGSPISSPLMVVGVLRGGYMLCLCGGQLRNGQSRPSRSSSRHRTAFYLVDVDHTCLRDCLLRPWQMCSCCTAAISARHDWSLVKDLSDRSGLC